MSKNTVKFNKYHCEIILDFLIENNKRRIGEQLIYRLFNTLYPHNNKLNRAKYFQYYYKKLNEKQTN